MLRLAIWTACVLVVVAPGVRGAQSPQPVPIMRQLAGTWTVTVTFPATGTGEQQSTTVVTLKRLSGIDQMMPR